MTDLYFVAAGAAAAVVGVVDIRVDQPAGTERLDGGGSFLMPVLGRMAWLWLAIAGAFNWCVGALVATAVLAFTPGELSGAVAWITWISVGGAFVGIIRRRRWLFVYFPLQNWLRTHYCDRVNDELDIRASRFARRANDNNVMAEQVRDAIISRIENTWYLRPAEQERRKGEVRGKHDGAQPGVARLRAMGRVALVWRMGRVIRATIENPEDVT